MNWFIFVFICSIALPSTQVNKNFYLVSFIIDYFEKTIKQRRRDGKNVGEKYGVRWEAVKWRIENASGILHIAM